MERKLTRTSTTALPLLLAKNLSETGVLEQLLRSSKDTVDDALDRAESYILINAVFHTVVRFGLGPWLMRPEGGSADSNGSSEQGANDDEQGSDEEEDEHTSLLPHQRPSKAKSESPWKAKSMHYLHVIHDRSKSWLNPALLGALVAIILGLIPFTHKQFFEEKGVFKKNIIQAVKQLGDLIPALLPFAVGSKLCSKPSKDAGYIAITYLFLIRFILLPGLSILALWVAKRKNTAFWEKDPVFDFVLVISGAGPPAITLMSVAEIGGAQADMIGKVARTLLLTYAATPALSLTVVAGLAVIKKLYA